MTTIEKKMDDISRKLVALKKLAEEARDENEGVAALLAIQRILKNNDLTETEYESMTSVIPEENRINTQDAGVEGVCFPRWMDLLHIIIAENFRCVAVVSSYYNSEISRNRRTKGYKFIGKGRDPEIALEAFTTAINVINSLWDQKIHIVRDFKSMLGEKVTTTDRYDYCTAFVYGLSAAFKEQIARDELGIILVRDPSVDDHIKGMKVEARELNLPHQTSSLSNSIGYVDGNNYGKGNVLKEVE